MSSRNDTIAQLCHWELLRITGHDHFHASKFFYADKPATIAFEMSIMDIVNQISIMEIVNRTHRKS